MATDVKVAFERAYKRFDARPAMAPFDPAADLLLHAAGQPPAGATTPDEVGECFADYFRFGGEPGDLRSPVPRTPCDVAAVPVWPIPATCVRLEGARGALETYPTLRRLFVGDVVWLFYMQELGIHQIVQVLLDDYETQGRHPFDVTRPYALVLEGMVRERRGYLGSRPLDRENLFRRVVGWTGDPQAKAEAAVNTAFAEHVDQLMALLARFYATRDLAVQLKESMGGTGPGPVTTSNLTAIQDTIQLLRRAMRTLEYGRNYANALVSLVWTVSGFALVRDVREVIGVPEPFTSADQYVPAAYDLLVAKGAASPTRINRYLAYRHLADHARDILIDVEVLDTLESDEALLRAWLDGIANRVLAYVAAYKALYDVDLASGARHKQRA